MAGQSGRVHFLLRAGSIMKLILPIGRQKALEGLTRDEVLEFEMLSKVAPVADEHEAHARDARWIDLYLKHEQAKIVRKQRLEART